MLTKEQIFQRLLREIQDNNSKNVEDILEGCDDNDRQLILQEGLSLLQSAVYSSPQSAKKLWSYANKMTRDLWYNNGTLVNIIEVYERATDKNSPSVKCLTEVIEEMKEHMKTRNSSEGFVPTNSESSDEEESKENTSVRSLGEYNDESESDMSDDEEEHEQEMEKHTRGLAGELRNTIQEHNFAEVQKILNNRENSDYIQHVLQRTVTLHGGSEVSFLRLAAQYFPESAMLLWNAADQSTRDLWCDNRTLDRIKEFHKRIQDPNSQDAQLLETVIQKMEKHMGARDLGLELRKAILNLNVEQVTELLEDEYAAKALSRVVFWQSGSSDYFLVYPLNINYNKPLNQRDVKNIREIFKLMLGKAEPWLRNFELNGKNYVVSELEFANTDKYFTDVVGEGFFDDVIQSFEEELAPGQDDEVLSISSESSNEEELEEETEEIAVSQGAIDDTEANFQTIMSTWVTYERERQKQSDEQLAYKLQQQEHADLRQRKKDEQLARESQQQYDAERNALSTQGFEEEMFDLEDVSNNMDVTFDPEIQQPQQNASSEQDTKQTPQNHAQTASASPGGEVNDIPTIAGTGDDAAKPNLKQKVTTSSTNHTKTVNKKPQSATVSAQNSTTNNTGPTNNNKNFWSENKIALGVAGLCAAGAVAAYILGCHIAVASVLAALAAAILVVAGIVRACEKSPETKSSGVSVSDGAKLVR